MPRNGSGTYTLPEAAFIPGTTISSAAVNDDLSDIASALTGSVSADGQTPITAPLKAASGISSAPTWTFNADTTSGLYLAGTGELGIVAGGSGMILNSTAATVASATVANAGGTNYLVGDTITLTGGTAPRQAVLTVATLSGSAVATVTVTDGGAYTTAPANPVSQGSTSGGGSGCTFTITTSTTSVMSSLTGAAVWQLLGSSSYMSGAMGQVSGVALANYIGAANLASAISTSLPIPDFEGYLTPVSNTPIITSDSIAATTIFYTPLNGVWAAIHNGANIVPYKFSQMQLNLSAAQGANGIFDIFLANNSGTPVIGTGPNWSAGTGGNITAGSCARGTGAGGTAIGRSSQGPWVNSAQITITYNNGTISGTVSVAIGQAVYLGSIYIDNTNGQVTCHRSWGQNRKFGIWNAYSRKMIVVQEGDSAASWTASGSVRASNNAPTVWSSTVFNVGSGTAANGITVLCGLAEESIECKFMQEVLVNNATSGNAIGINSITVASGKFSSFGNGVAAGINGEVIAYQVQPPTLGLITVCALDAAASGAGTATNFGTNGHMVLSALYNG